MKHRRKKYLINARVQVLAALVSCATSCVGLMLFAVLANGLLTQVGADYPGLNDTAMADIQSGLQANLMIVFLAVIPLSSAVAILFTFRLVGPLYRMTQHLTGIANGENMGTCRIRKNDELQEFCQLLNQAVERLQDDRGASGEEKAAPTEESSEIVRAA